MSKHPLMQQMLGQLYGLINWNDPSRWYRGEPMTELEHQRKVLLACKAIADRCAAERQHALDRMPVYIPPPRDNIGFSIYGKLSEAKRISDEISKLIEKEELL